MIRDQFKRMELKITDLADYLHMSRTTIYNFMDAYDKGDKSVISQKVLKLLDYGEEGGSFFHLVRYYR